MNTFVIELSIVKASITTGAVDDVEVVSALRPNTALVSIMLANNETGVIQPVGKIARAVRRWQRETGGEMKVFVHTDAAQVWKEWSFSVRYFPLDTLMTCFPAIQYILIALVPGLPMFFQHTHKKKKPQKGLIGDVRKCMDWSHYLGCSYKSPRFHPCNYHTFSCENQLRL